MPPLRQHQYFISAFIEIILDARILFQ